MPFFSSWNPSAETGQAKDKTLAVQLSATRSEVMRSRIERPSLFGFQILFGTTHLPKCVKPNWRGFYPNSDNQGWAHWVTNKISLWLNIGFGFPRQMDVFAQLSLETWHHPCPYLPELSLVNPLVQSAPTIPLGAYLSVFGSSAVWMCLSPASRCLNFPVPETAGSQWQRAYTQEK